jgi:hypothetical protein
VRQLCTGALRLGDEALAAIVVVVRKGFPDFQTGSCVGLLHKHLQGTCRIGGVHDQLAIGVVLGLHAVGGEDVAGLRQIAHTDDGAGKPCSLRRGRRRDAREPGLEGLGVRNSSRSEPRRSVQPSGPVLPMEMRPKACS